MRFQYDPSKAASNLKKHGVSFADAEGVLLDSASDDEKRFVAVGMGNAGQILIVV